MEEDFIFCQIKGCTVLSVDGPAMNVMGINTINLKVTEGYCSCVLSGVSRSDACGIPSQELKCKQRMLR